MKRKVSAYIKKIYKEIRDSEEKQFFFSEYQPTDFDQPEHFQKISEHINVKKQYVLNAPINKRNWLLAAASLIGIIFISYYFYNRNSSNNASVVWESKIAPIDGIDSVVLEDGTKVWLNLNSSLKYPKHFSEITREVTLRGEAYFEVKHNPQKPFIIRSQNINTTVLGTSFDVNAYPDNPMIEVTVKTGKVKVADSSNKNSIHILTQKEQVSFHKKDNDFSVKENVDINSSIGWQNGNLIFEDKALKDILPLLNKKFHITINIDNSIRSSQITANFEGEPLTNILQVLATITNASVDRQNNIYFLKKSEK